MRKLATIQKIESISPHGNADKLEIAKILGWKTVVRKGDFKPDQIIVFIEPDAILPKTEWSSFLQKEDKPIRIKVVRLRGEISQGLVLPTSILPEGVPSEIGSDVTEILGITKYEPPEPAANMKALVRGPFPTELCPKTDETRIQSVPLVLERHRGKKFAETEKLDGTSTTIILKDSDLHVCSRNLDLKEMPDHAVWQFVRENKIEEKMRELNRNLAIQGEFAGLGIQGNPLKLPDKNLYVFNVLDVDKREYLNHHEMVEIANKLQLKTVPIINDNLELNHTIDELVKLATGPSNLNPNVKREGIVLRALTEERDEELGRLSFKVISPVYLLEHDL